MPRLSLTLKGPETKSTKGHCFTGKSRARPAYNSPTKCTLVQNCTLRTALSLNPCQQHIRRQVDDLSEPIRTVLPCRSTKESTPPPHRQTTWQQSQRSHHWWQLALCRVMPCTKLGTKKAWKPERILLGKGVSKQATSLHKKNYRGAEAMSTAKEGI